MVRSGMSFLIITVLSAVCFDFVLNSTSDSAIVVQRDADGQFLLPVKINDQEMLFLIDTGASHMVLSAAQARSLNLDVHTDDFNWSYHSGPHRGEAQPLRISSAQIGTLRLENIDAAVVRGDMTYGLLGRSFLRKLKELEIKGDQLFIHL